MRYHILWATQKFGRVGLSIVNSTHIQTLTICQKISFLCIPNYKYLALRFYHSYRIYAYVHLDFFLGLFETFKFYFRLLF
jgi:hypothetical protein